MPALGRALLAGSMLGGVIVAVLWPMLRAGPALWHLPWLELTMGGILAALAEAVDLRARRGAAPEAWTERGAKVTAVVREDPTPLPWPILHREGRFTLYAIPRA